ncbi:extracellular solute-binding protein [Streptomyces sp. BI20]|uniref:extracellular solute-binding protein n=1 Tax=Streptomyces sp. BI20 TaxID=3403460 RepID=UPI003C750A66
MTPAAAKVPGGTPESRPHPTARTSRTRAGAVALGVVASLTLTLGGCGTLGLTGDNEVTLKVVAADYGDSPANSSKGYWDKLARDFEEANPGVKVDVSVYSWSEVDAKVAEMVKAGKAPDIAQIGAYADHAAAGRLYSADEVLKVTTQADFQESLADAGKVGRVQYGMPFVASTRLLFYNRKLLDEAGVAKADTDWHPKTWADLESAAKALKERAKVKTPVAIPLGREEAQAETMIWTLAGGGGYTDPDESYAIDSPANAATFTWIRDHLTGPGLTGPVAPASLDRQAAFDAFTRGEVGMLNGHPTLMKQAQAKGIEYGMTPMPTLDGAEEPTMGVADWVMAFKNGHPAEAGKFLDTLFAQKNVTAFTDTYGLLPTTSSGYRAMESSADPKVTGLKTFLKTLPASRLYPVNKESWAATSETVKTGIGAAVAPGGQPAKVLARIAAQARAADAG